MHSTQGLRNSVTMVCSLQTSLPSLPLDVNRHRSCPHPLRKFPVKLSQMLQQAVKNKTSLRGGGCNHHIIYCVTERSVENPMATCTSFCTSQHRRFSITMSLLRSNSRTTSTVQRFNFVWRICGIHIYHIPSPHWEVVLHHQHGNYPKETLLFL